MECCAIVESGFPPRRCGRPATQVSLPCPCGRPDAVGGPYCDEHGGEARARAEAETDWNYQAPASVGSATAVHDAGHMHLDTRDAYLVVRPETGKEGGPSSDRWLAWLGIGSFLLGVRAPGTVPHRRRREHMADYRARCALDGSYAFRSRHDALTEATRVWRERLAAHVHEIRLARGGTLDWGVPVQPLTDPIIIDATDRNAWDVATALPRRCGPGVSLISGLRPSGEAP